MKISRGRLIFNCPLFLMAIYALLLILLLNLGFWQLNRAEEKRVLIEKQTQSMKTTSLQLTAMTEDNSEKLRYKKATIRGHYDNAHQILLDNQIFKGKAGYFVFTPFIVENGKKAILVNRGWVIANPNRTILPDVNFKTLPTIIRGRINAFPSVGIKLVGAEMPTNSTPPVIQIVDSQLLAKKLAYPLFSFQFELDAAMPEGYIRQWMTATLMSPEQHFGYALQWFGLAITLSILFFWFSIKKQVND